MKNKKIENFFYSIIILYLLISIMSIMHAMYIFILMSIAFNFF